MRQGERRMQTLFLSLSPFVFPREELVFPSIHTTANSSLDDQNDGLSGCG